MQGKVSVSVLGLMLRLRRWEISGEDLGLREENFGIPFYDR